MKITILISIALMSLAGCKKDLDPSRLSGLRVAYADRSDKDVLVPKRLVSEIESEYLQKFKRENSISTKTDGQILTNIPRSFLSFDIYLLPNPNKLAFEVPYHFNFPRGGGVIDLKNFVEGQSGSFKLILRLHQEDKGLTEEDLSNINVYFMSNSKRRVLANETFGAGCGKYLKLTNFFHQTLSKDGLELNATEGRHISLIGGSFYFFLIKDGVLHLGSTSFEDSRYPDLVCQV